MGNSIVLRKAVRSDAFFIEQTPDGTFAVTMSIGGWDSKIWPVATMNTLEEAKECLERETAKWEKEHDELQEYVYSKWKEQQEAQEQG